MLKRKADTVLKVTEPMALMDFLIAKMGGMARSSVKQLLGQRRVKVGNAVQTRHDFELKPGDVVTVSSGRGNSQLTHPKLKIVYEDDDLIVVNKQPGLLTVATERAREHIRRPSSGPRDIRSACLRTLRGAATLYARILASARHRPHIYSACRRRTRTPRRENNHMAD